MKAPSIGPRALWPAVVIGATLGLDCSEQSNTRPLADAGSEVGIWFVGVDGGFLAISDADPSTPQAKPRPRRLRRRSGPS
jgi:hypothetical protein